MGKLTKLELAKLSNEELATKIDRSEKQVITAFKNYNRIMEFLSNSALDREGMVQFFIKKSEVKDRKDFDVKLAEIAIKNGPLENSISELGALKNINIETINVLIEAMQNVDLSEEEEIEDEGNTVKNPKKNNTPQPHYNPSESLATLALFSSSLTNPASILPSGLTRLIDGVKEDLEKVKDLVTEGKDIVEAGKDGLKALDEAKDILTGKKKGGGGTATKPRTTTGEVKEGEQKPEEINGNIDDDEYFDLFGEALEKEPAYTVWIDRIMAFEVDGAGDDNIFWTSQIKVFLKNPRKKIITSFVSFVYNIDEREEYRLKPKLPVNDKRALPLPKDDWLIRGFIEKNDANLALRANGDIRGIPLSRLDKLEIDINLYESDSVNQLIEAIAALGAAAIAALRIIKGKFTAPAGSTKEATEALERGLKRLNKLINSDDLILSDSFTFNKGHFKTAFDKGQTFPVKQRGSIAAIGMPYQRVAQAVRETNNEPLDTGSLDKYLDRYKSKKKDQDFYEDKFDSYYEVRLRFEKHEPEEEEGN